MYFVKKLYLRRIKLVTNYCFICDKNKKKNDMKTAKNDIITYIKRNRHGKIFFTDKFRKFSSNEAIRKLPIYIFVARNQTQIYDKFVSE
jgi:hypothetical protein